jgi:hypothetical protein
MQVCWNKGPGPLQRGDKYRNVKMGWGHLKIFSRTTWPILTRPGTNHAWVKGLQVCSNEGNSPYPRGDNSERVKLHCIFFFKILCRNSRPNSIKPSAHYPWVNGIQDCWNKGPDPLQRGDNHKNVKMGRVIEKSSSSEPARQIQSNLMHFILGWRECKFVKIKGQALFKGEIITKM